MHDYIQTTAATASDIEPTSSAYNWFPVTTTSTTVDNSTPSVGTAPYVRDATAYLELAAFVLIDVVGFVGNVFVLGVVVLCKEMQTVANFFIVSLSVADLLVSLLVTPLLTATRWRRAWLLGEVACDFQAVINHTCLFASLFSLATISVNRVVITRRPGRYHKYFSKPLCYLYISITWFFSLLYSVLPLLGWGEFKYDQKRYNCIFSRQAAPSYSLFFASCCVLLPQVICAACYVTILVTFIQSRLALQDIAEVTVIGNTAASEAKLTKNLFVVWLAFFFCWLPMNTLLLIDPKGEQDERVYTVAVWLMLANSCVNPIIYGVQNKHFRKGYLTMLQKTALARMCLKARVHPTAAAAASGGSSRSRSGQNQTAEKTMGSNTDAPSPNHLALPLQAGHRNRQYNPGTCGNSET